MSAGDRKVLANVVKNMKKRDSDPLSALIDRYLVERERPENRDKRMTEWTLDLKDNVRPLGRISPSSIGGCQRQAVLKFVGMDGEKRINPDTQLIFEDGHWRHHKWQAMFTEMEAILGSSVFRCYAIEMRVKYKKLYIAGALDVHVGIAEKDELVDWVIDVKGINKWGFNDIMSSNEPKMAHVLQLISYMRARRVRRGILFYDCKDDQRYKVFTIRFSAKQWAEVEDWASGVLRAVEHAQLPPRHVDCDNGTMLYERCPYRKVCFGQYTNVQIERRAFRGMPSMDELWEEGLRREEEG